MNPGCTSIKDALTLEKVGLVMVEVGRKLGGQKRELETVSVKV